MLPVGIRHSHREPDALWIMTDLNENMMPPVEPMNSQMRR
jgi:hypothetical protein